MRNYRAEGVIIKRTNYGEADRIITVFTKEFGKVKILAKGVRRITSRRSSNVELFNLAILFVHKGKTFDILTEAQVKETFQDNRNELGNVGRMYYICELLDGLCAEQQPHPEVFDLLINTLLEINAETVETFSFSLLVHLGFWAKNKPANPQILGSAIEQLLNRKLKSKHILAKIS